MHKVVEVVQVAQVVVQQEGPAPGWAQVVQLEGSVPGWAQALELVEP